MTTIIETERKDGEYSLVMQIDETDAKEIKVSVLETWKNGDQLDTIYLERDQAIAAAKAILKHFNVGLESDQ